MNITPICKRFGRRANHFTDTKVAQGKFATREGRAGGTVIDDDIVHEFLIWLHPTIRATLARHGIEAAQRQAKEWV